ncbi:hypothetical protein Ancab_017152, partial [Ancistrocladus abbreviatus]
RWFSIRVVEDQYRDGSFWMASNFKPEVLEGATNLSSPCCSNQACTGMGNKNQRINGGSKAGSKNAEGVTLRAGSREGEDGKTRE